LQIAMPLRWTAIDGLLGFRDMQADRDHQTYPALRRIGEDGVLVEFGAGLSDAANIAALSFSAAISKAAPAWCLEQSTALKSVYLRFDPLSDRYDHVAEWLRGRLDERDWSAASLPDGRRLWRIPVAFGGAHGPQLGEVADLIGRSEAVTVEDLVSARLRVLAMGFAPGMPYLGILPEHWDIPRQSELTPSVPDGAIAVAVRQVVAFAVKAQTGWRQVGRGAFRAFDADRSPAFLFSGGDEVVFEPVSAGDLDRLRTGEIAMPASDLIS